MEACKSPGAYPGYGVCWQELHKETYWTQDPLNNSKRHAVSNSILGLAWGPTENVSLLLELLFL